MQQIKQTNCIIISETQNPLINKIVVFLNAPAVTYSDEIVEKSRVIVDNYMKSQHIKKKFNFKKLLPVLISSALGVIAGIIFTPFIWHYRKVPLYYL